CVLIGGAAGWVMTALLLKPASAYQEPPRDTSQTRRSRAVQPDLISETACERRGRGELPGTYESTGSRPCSRLTAGATADLPSLVDGGVRGSEFRSGVRTRREAPAPRRGSMGLPPLPALAGADTRPTTGGRG